MNLAEMNKYERSLLLFIESCCCDFGGTVDTRRINAEELEILKRWNDSEFISFSRLTMASIANLTKSTHAVMLSDEAWNLAHEERKARFKRMHDARTWQTTAELRAN